MRKREIANPTFFTASSYRGLKSQKTPLFYIRNVYRSYGIYQDVRTSSSVAKVPSQFALSVMGREKLSIEILGRVSSKQTSSGNDWKWTSMDIHCTPSCLVLTWIFFWFTHGLPMAYPFTKALLRLWRPAKQPTLSAAKAQRANGHAFLLGLGIVGPGKIIRTRLQNHLAFAQFKLSLHCATSGKSIWIKKAQHGKTWIKHWKSQRVLQASKNATPALAFVAFSPFQFPADKFEYPCLHPLATDPAVAVFVEEILLQPIPHMYSRPNIITDNDRNHVVTCPKTLLPQNPIQIIQHFCGTKIRNEVQPPPGWNSSLLLRPLQIEEGPLPLATGA